MIGRKEKTSQLSGQISSPEEACTWCFIGQTTWQKCAIFVGPWPFWNHVIVAEDFAVSDLGFVQPTSKSGDLTAGSHPPPSLLLKGQKTEKHRRSLLRSSFGLMDSDWWLLKLLEVKAWRFPVVPGAAFATTKPFHFSLTEDCWLVLLHLLS